MAYLNYLEWSLLFNKRFGHYITLNVYTLLKQIHYYWSVLIMHASLLFYLPRARWVQEHVCKLQSVTSTTVQWLQAVEEFTRNLQGIFWFPSCRSVCCPAFCGLENRVLQEVKCLNLIGLAFLAHLRCS